MTNEQKPEYSTSKLPSHIAYHVKDRNGGKGIWMRIGSAWQHADSSGFNIQIESIPLDGRITLRTRTEDQD
jgi:hypothetical protein